MISYPFSTMWCFKPDNPYIYWKRKTATNCWPICDISDHQINVLCNFSAPFPCIFLSRYIRKCPQSMSNIYEGVHTLASYLACPRLIADACSSSWADAPGRMPCHRRRRDTTSQLGKCQPAFFQPNQSYGCKQECHRDWEFSWILKRPFKCNERPRFPLN